MALVCGQCDQITGCYIHADAMPLDYHPYAAASATPAPVSEPASETASAPASALMHQYMSVMSVSSPVGESEESEVEVEVEVISDSDSDSETEVEVEVEVVSDSETEEEVEVDSESPPQVEVSELHSELLTDTPGRNTRSARRTIVEPGENQWRFLYNAK